jgi:hypothetical protein
MPKENSVIMPVKMKFMSWTWSSIKEFCPMGVRFETVQLLCVLLSTWHSSYLTKLKICECKDSRSLLQFRLHLKLRSSSVAVIVAIYYQIQQTGWMTPPSQKWTPSPLPKETEARKVKWVMNLLWSGMRNSRHLCNMCTLLPEFVTSHPRRQQAS